MDRKADSYTIMVVDDDSGLSTLIQKLLQREGFRTAGVYRGADAVEWLEHNQADLMLLDFKLPDMTGRQVIKILAEKNKPIPFILVTGQGDEKLAVEIMKGGARDYIIKDGGFLELLPSVVTRVLEQVERENQLRTAEKALIESEAQYRGVFNSSLDAILVVDFNGKIVDANPQACKIYDYALEELINLPFKKLIHPDYQYQYDQFTMDLQSKGEFQAESLALQKDGTTIDVEIRSIVFAFKGQKNILIVARDISERKWKEEELRLTNQQLRVSEQALREREARLRAIFQGAAIGVALIDLGGRALESNQSLQKMLGYSRTELRQKVFAEFTHPQDLQAGVQIFKDLTQGKCDYYQIETRYLRKDEGIVWVRLTASLVRNDSGKPNYIINMMEDISEQKWAEQNLRESQERFRLLSEAAFEGVVIHEQGRILDANAALGRMFGYENIPEIIGKDCRDFVTPEFRELVTQNIRKDTTEPYELVGLKKDGSTFNIQVWARSLQYQGRTVRVVAIRDVTEQKIARADLEKSEARYRGLFENMHSAFAYHQVLLNEQSHPVDYVFLEVNDAFEQMTGLKRKQVLGKKVSQAIPAIKSSDFDWIETYGKVALTGQSVKFEQYSEQLNRWYAVSAYSLQKGYFAVIFDDITERRQIEEEIRIFAADLERSNRDLEQFARIISQHLQEPLRAITDQCRIFDENHLDQSRGPDEEFARQTYMQTRRMQMKIDALLEYSKITAPGRPHLKVNLKETALKAQDALREKINQSGAQVEIGSLPAIPGNQMHLQKLFENLIDNALKFRSSAPPEVHVDCRDQEQGYEITVSDNGRGIDSSELEKIFDLFYRRPDQDQYPGSGIGLSLVRKIAELHGGRIWAESKLGRGSTFHIAFPIKKKTKTDLATHKISLPSA